MDSYEQERGCSFLIYDVYKVMRGCWCDSVINVTLLTEDEKHETQDSF
jgi:hypothetical protein